MVNFCVFKTEKEANEYDRICFEELNKTSEYSCTGWFTPILRGDGNWVMLSLELVDNSQFEQEEFKESWFENKERSGSDL